MHTQEETKQSLPSSHHSAFNLKRRESIGSLNIVVEEYEHNRTGALHYHISAENTENVFLVGFRTMPKDSTGVAHILEHTVLCGSENYPVRDPFFMMIRRSLNTFMNAFTSSDWTAYPFASQNRKDYFNLMNVYLDAVFFSRLNKLDFMQEGHRLEFENPEDAESNLIYKGVVFNEMIGSMASPVNTLWQTLTKYLFPNTTYHFNSGGDPEHIPDLSYENFIAFYKSHYHPSNAVFMTYGDIPVHDIQQNIETKALYKFDRLDHGLHVEPEKRYHAPITVEEHYALEEEGSTDNKTHIVMGWLLGDSINLEESLKVHLLSGVLLDNSSSPLLNALETTDLGSAPSPLCGVEDSNREITFMCGIEGSSPDKSAALDKLVLDVLHDVAEKGVPLEQMESVLHQLELEQREISGGHYPYGLQLILEGLSSAVHYGDPVAVLNLDPVLEKLQQSIKDPEFIKNLVKEYLLNNPHRVRLSLIPDPKLNQHRQLAQAAKLAKIKSSMSDSEKSNIIDLSHKLEQRQQQVDDESVLPKVGLEDIPESMQIAEGENTHIGQFNSTWFNQGTNGLVYQQLICPLPELDDTLAPLLPYFTGNLTELGSGGRDYLKTQALQASVTGGISAFTLTRGKVDDVNSTASYFFISGKALTRNHKSLSQLIRDTYETPRFDELERIKDLISQQRAHREQSVTGSGHSYAMIAASSGISPAAALKHNLSGLAGIKFTKQLDDSLKDPEQLKQFASQLENIHSAIVKSRPQLLLIGEQDKYNQLTKDIESVWQDFATTNNEVNIFTPPTAGQHVKQMWIANSPINFCSKAYATVPIEHEDAAALSVLAGFLRNGFLHTAIREKGGAYGGGASFSAEIAAFRFYSYRDPRLSETLDDFDSSIDWLLSKDHKSEKLEEAILGVISSIDKPTSPAGEAKDAFQNNLFGRTPEKRQMYRKRILEVSVDDLKRVAATYLKPENANIAVITNSATLESKGNLDLDVINL